jgi:hypothetical protein
MITTIRKTFEDQRQFFDADAPEKDIAKVGALHIQSGNLAIAQMAELSLIDLVAIWKNIDQYLESLDEPQHRVIIMEYIGQEME